MNKDITLEDLDFELVNETPMLYQKNDGGFIQNIEFINAFKRVRLSNYETYNNDQSQDEYCLYVNELQAIYNKCKELGWLDE